MSGKARGQVATRRRRGTTRYALRFATAGKRHYKALGSERDGWSPGLAEGVLFDLRGGFLAGDASCPEGDRRHERSGG